MAQRTQRVLLLVIGAVAVIGVFAVASDLRDVGAKLGGFAWSAWFAALALTLGNYALRFVRWNLYLRHLRIRVPTGKSLLVFIAGFSLSITPAKLGELIKSYLLRELCAVPIATSAPIVIAERIGDLLALVCLAIGGVAIYGVADQIAIVSAAVVGAGLAVIAWPRLCNAIIALLTAPRLTRRFRERGHTLYEGLSSLVRPIPLLWSTPLGIAAWALECIGFAVVLSGFGVDAPLGLVTMIYAATTLAGALSFLPGGLGVTEGAMTLLLIREVGIDDGTAVAATVLIRLATLWFAVVLGLGAMAILRRSAGETALRPDDTTVLPPGAGTT